jgi:uncharacterized glyoxalase superfamily protein PhnB
MTTAGASGVHRDALFRPESVDALYEQIKEHTTPAWGPEVREWGTRELGVQDPNGYFLTFTEPA